MKKKVGDLTVRELFHYCDDMDDCRDCNFYSRDRDSPCKQIKNYDLDEEIEVQE